MKLVRLISGGGVPMGEIMSEETKYELAEELGFADKVSNGDWGQITTREAGSMVKRAIEKVEEDMVQQESGSRQ